MSISTRIFRAIVDPENVSYRKDRLTIMAEDVVREIIRFREDHDMPETLPNDADVLQTMLDGEVDHEFDIVGTVFGIIKKHGGDPDILEALFKRYPPDSVVAVIKEYFPHVLGDPKN